MLHPFGFGKLCQPHCESVASGTVLVNASAKVCSPVASAVKANSPLPTENGFRRQIAEHGRVPRHQRAAVNPLRPPRRAVQQQAERHPDFQPPPHFSTGTAIVTDAPFNPAAAAVTRISPPFGRALTSAKHSP